VMGVKASSGMPSSSRAGVAPMRLLPHWMLLVQEAERLAGVQGLHPQGHLAQLDGHLVDVHAVEAVAHHVAQGQRGWPRAMAPRRRCAPGPGGGPAGWRRRSGNGRNRRRVDDFDGQQGRFPHRPLPRFALPRSRSATTGSSAVSSRLLISGRRVVAAGGLALAAGGRLQGENRRARR
jgi:hypothetical protein